MTVIDDALNRLDAKREVKLIVLEALAEVDLPTDARQRLLEALRKRGVLR